MAEQPEIKQALLEDSNMAEYGSEESRDLKRSVAKRDKAWRSAGAKLGVQIWRIEKFKVKKWPEDRYGEFYGGDSYIILHTKLSDAGKKEYDVCL